MLAKLNSPEPARRSKVGTAMTPNNVGGDARMLTRKRATRRRKSHLKGKEQCPL